MDEELGHEKMWWGDDDSWAFPILVNNEENGGKLVGNSGGEPAAAREVDHGLPPPPPASKGRKRRSGGGDQSENHELHLWSERERRKRMRDMFANLHALVPNLPPKADKATIVDEALVYIKKLQLTLTQLQKLKEEKKLKNTINPSLIPLTKHMIQSREVFLAEQGSTSTKNVISSAIATLSNPNNTLNALFYSGPEFPAIFKTWASPNVILNVCGPDAHINVCGPKKPGTLTAICFVMEKYKLEVISTQVSFDRGRRMYMVHAHANGGSNAVILVEEIYKQAAAEIMLWINS